MAVEENAAYKGKNDDENAVSLLAPSFSPLLPCAIPQQQEQNNEQMVTIATATSAEMVEGGADREVLEGLGCSRFCPCWHRCKASIKVLCLDSQPQCLLPSKK
jgi:hypothetical protein